MTIGERKTAHVFGGARGIGAAAVGRLAEDGYDVAFTYVSRPDSAQALVAEIEKSGRRAVAIQADSADADAIRGAVAKTVDIFGPVSLEELDLMIDINIRGVFLSIQSSVPYMKDGGRVIRFGSSTAENWNGWSKRLSVIQGCGRSDGERLGP